MSRNRTGYIFEKGNISEIFQRILENIQSTVDGEKEDYILNVNETEYANHLESIHKLNVPEISFEQVEADIFEKEIPAEAFPFNFHVRPGKKYKKEVIQFFVQCSGDISLLNYCPSSIMYLGASSFKIQNHKLLFEYINFTNNPEEIKRAYDNEVNGTLRTFTLLKQDIEVFNDSLKAQIISHLHHRKEKFLSKNSLLASLGVPLRKKENVPLTFAVPNPKLREKIIIKPVVHEEGFKPEPTLDESNYRKILKLINDVGKNFERMPSIYKDKGEEDLRDHLLMTIDPNFEYGSASGETFNKTGKTDIQLRYDSSVVFIAECKFWGGEKMYFSTIDQLLGYLTWRDTKASVIVFVRQKGFSTILEKILNETSKHPNYLGFVDRPDENWFNFRFHINDDRNREIKLAVQLYHLPS